MDIKELRGLFEKHRDDHGAFEKVETKRSRRADLHGFILLDELVPNSTPDRDILACAEHDEVYLSIDPEDLAAVVTEAQVLELVRCGVFLAKDGLCMFV